MAHHHHPGPVDKNLDARMIAGLEARFLLSSAWSPPPQEPARSGSNGVVATILTTRNSLFRCSPTIPLSINRGEVKYEGREEGPNYGYSHIPAYRALTLLDDGRIVSGAGDLAYTRSFRILTGHFTPEFAALVADFDSSVASGAAKFLRRFRTECAAKLWWPAWQACRAADASDSSDGP